MAEKYTIFTIYELENGWLVKEEPRQDPHNVDEPEYISTFFPNLKDACNHIIKKGAYIKK